MMDFGFSHAAIAFLAAFTAGAINSVAGGGTLISFPTLVWLGLPSVTANATSTVAILPGSLAGAWGYRRELRTAERHMLALVAPSLIGGISGALLLQHTTPGFFDKLVPYLIAFATVLFMAQDRVQKRSASARMRAAPRRSTNPRNGSPARWRFSFAWAFTAGISARASES